MKIARKRQQKTSAHIYGLRAEAIAAFYLRLKGYSIVARRFKTRLGEIDIIARRGCLIAIVEVKARPSLEQAHNAIDKTKRNRMIAATDLWYARQRDHSKLTIRFDAIIIRPWCLPHHIKGFFNA